jgi:hypothetical protein
MSDTPKSDLLERTTINPSDWILLARYLERENAELRKDKARLDWLEKHLYTLWASGLRLNESPLVEISTTSGRHEASTIRAAIDAAMKERK